MGDSLSQPTTESAAEVDPREYCKFRYSAPSECCKCGNCQLVPPARLVAWSDQIEALDSRIEELEKALREIVEAKALSGVRAIVAGWNGEGRDEPFTERHPYGLGATLPKTCCGHVYELDEAMQAARAVLQPKGVAV